MVVQVGGTPGRLMKHDGFAADIERDVGGFGALIDDRHIDRQHGTSERV